MLPKSTTIMIIFIYTLEQRVSNMNLLESDGFN